MTGVPRAERVNPAGHDAATRAARPSDPQHAGRALDGAQTELGELDLTSQYFSKKFCIAQVKPSPGAYACAGPAMWRTVFPTPRPRPRRAKTGAELQVCEASPSDVHRCSSSDLGAGLV